MKVLLGPNRLLLIWNSRGEANPAEGKGPIKCTNNIAHVFYHTKAELFNRLSGTLHRSTDGGRRAEGSGRLWLVLGVSGLGFM